MKISASGRIIISVKYNRKLYAYISMKRKKKKKAYVKRGKEGGEKRKYI